MKIFPSSGRSFIYCLFSSGRIHRGEPEPEPGESGGRQSAGKTVREPVQVSVMESEEGRVPFPGGDAAQEISACVEEKWDLPGVRTDIDPGGIPEEEPLSQGESVDQPADRQKNGCESNPFAPVMAGVDGGEFAEEAFPSLRGEIHDDGVQELTLIKPFGLEAAGGGEDFGREEKPFSLLPNGLGETCLRKQRERPVEGPRLVEKHAPQHESLITVGAFPTMKAGLAFVKVKSRRR